MGSRRHRGSGPGRFRPKVSYRAAPRACWQQGETQYDEKGGWQTGGRYETVATGAGFAGGHHVPIPTLRGKSQHLADHNGLGRGKYDEEVRLGTTRRSETARFVNAREAAEMLGVSQRAVRNLVGRKVLEGQTQGVGAAARLVIPIVSVERIRSERQQGQ